MGGNNATTAQERIAIARTRLVMHEVVKAWGDQRGVDVKELLFRIRTKRVELGPREPSSAP